MFERDSNIKTQSIKIATTLKRIQIIVELKCMEHLTISEIHSAFIIV